MDAFDRAIMQTAQQEQSYVRQVADETTRRQNNRVTIGAFLGRAGDGTFRFRTPGGGIRRVYSNSSGGFTEGSLSMITQTGNESGFADTDAPAALPREDVRGGPLLI